MFFADLTDFTDLAYKSIRKLTGITKIGVIFPTDCANKTRKKRIPNKLFTDKTEKRKSNIRESYKWGKRRMQRASKNKEQ